MCDDSSLVPPRGKLLRTHNSEPKKHPLVHNGQNHPGKGGDLNAPCLSYREPNFAPSRVIAQQ